MKKILSIIILGALPAFVLASGDHASEHNHSSTHEMGNMSHGMNEVPHDERQNALGKSGDPAKVIRVIEIAMDDSMQFTPSEISAKAGETIRFLIRNNGKLTHEMVIGSMEELKEHAAMMRSMPGMQHAEPNMITLATGQRGGIVWQFDQAGVVDFACLVPGHMEADMIGKIVIKRSS